MPKDAGKEFKIHKLLPEHEVSLYFEKSGETPAAPLAAHVRVPRKVAVAEAPTSVFPNVAEAEDVAYARPQG